MTDLREIGESAANAVLERVGRGVSKVQERRPLAYDVLESDDAYLVVFDAPGATREDVQVRFLDNEVNVQVDRFREFHEGFEMRLPGRGLSLSGSAELPEGAVVDPTGASATLAESGTLRIRVPKERSGEAVAIDEDDEVEPAESDVVDAVTDRDLDAPTEADETDGDSTAGDEEIEPAESDVVDAVTDRDLDAPTEADETDGDGGVAVDEEAADYGGAVTADETNTGGVDVDSDGEGDESARTPTGEEPDDATASSGDDGDDDPDDGDVGTSKGDDAGGDGDDRGGA